MVSVVIPTYGRPQKLKDAIISALSQLYGEIEVIVVDDNGIRTPDQIQTEKTIKTFSDKRIKYIVHEKNKGGCAARNTGIINSNGDFIAFLDDDDIWNISYISKMVKCFDSEKIGAVYCDFYLSDGEKYWGFKNRIHYEGAVYKHLLGGWCPVSTSLVVVRKKTIIEAGMFDTDLKSFQDYDMWLRMSRICLFRYVDERLIIKYENIGEQVSVSPDKRRAGFETICKKWHELIDDSDKHIFEGFKQMYSKGMEFSSVVYYVETRDKKNREKVIKYLISGASIIEKLKVIKRIVLPKSLRKRITYIHMNRNRNCIVLDSLPNDYLT